MAHRADVKADLPLGTKVTGVVITIALEWS